MVKKIISSLLLKVVLLNSFSLISAQTITISDFINQLKEVHPLFEKERLTTQIEQEHQNSYKGKQDWNIITSASYSHEDPLLAFSGPEQTDAISISGGVERLFWNTGGRLSASYTTNYAELEIDPIWGFPSSIYQNQFAITYSHPLLKNRKGFLDRLEYELKQFDVDFSEVQSQENVEEFLAESASKFLDWVFLYEQKLILAERLKLSKEELDRTERKRVSNLVNQVDVLRAEDAVRIWNQNLVLVETQLNALRAELSVLTKNSKIKNLIPEYNLYKLDEIIPLDKATTELVETSRILKNLNIRKKQLEIVQKGFKESAKADLTAYAQLNTKNLDENFGESFKMDKPDAVIGVQLSFPLENRTAKSQIIKTELQLSQLDAQFKELTITLSAALANIYVQLIEIEKVLALNQEQIESAKERTIEEWNLYNQGRSDLTFVIMSRDNEQNAKLTYAQNAMIYHKLSIEYKALMDRLYN